MEGGGWMERMRDRFEGEGKEREGREEVRGREGLVEVLARTRPSQALCQVVQAVWMMGRAVYCRR